MRWNISIKGSNGETNYFVTNDLLAAVMEDARSMVLRLEAGGILPIGTVTSIDINRVQ